MSPSMAYKELDRLMSILTQETYQSSAKHWRAGRSLPVAQVHRHSLTLVLHVDMASLRWTWYHSHWTNHTASSSNRNIHQGLLIFTKLQGLGPAAPQGQPSSCTHWEHCRSECHIMLVVVKEHPSSCGSPSWTGHDTVNMVCLLLG